MLEIHLLYVGIPLLAVLIVAGLIFRHKGPHPATYKLSEKWTHEPILWASVDEPIPGLHGHGSHGVTIGGGASGKW